MHSTPWFACRSVLETWLTTRRTTATGAVLRLLGFTNRDQMKEIIDALPADLLKELREFVREYQPGTRVFRGSPPDPSAVRIAEVLLTSMVKAD